MGNTQTTIATCLKDATNEEKNIFITVLYTLANADGNISTDEQDYLQSLTEELGIIPSSRFWNTPQSMCIRSAHSIKKRRLALELIKYMLILAFTDSNFTDDEGHFIGKIAEALKIEPAKVAEISSWIIDRIIWLEQEDVIFEETN